MSFNYNNNNDLEGLVGIGNSARYTDYPEFDTYSQLIENGIYNINHNQINSIRSLLQQFESILSQNEHVSADKKLEILSHKLGELFRKGTSNFKSVNDSVNNLNVYLKECEKNHEDDDTLKYLKQKESILVKSVKHTLEKFQSLQKKLEALQLKTISNLESQQENAQTAHSEATDSSPSQVTVQIEYEPINAEELEQQSLMIQEREREIHRISNDISEINDIFSNLHNIVNEQQISIDSIEDNILRFNDDARGASSELNKASRYQKRSSGRMLCCLFILLFLLGIIIILILLF